MNVRITRIVTSTGLDYYRSTELHVPYNIVASDKYLNNLIRRLHDHNHTIINRINNDQYIIRTKYESY